MSGAQAPELSEAAPAWLDVRAVGAEVGLASAVKMCTASVYKGHTALLTHALVTAHANGVLAEVLDDLHDSFPAQIDRAARLLAVSTTKAGRFVGEMREIAVTQASAGLTPALFEAIAEVYARLAETDLGAQRPSRSRPSRRSRRCSRGLRMRARGLEPPRAEAHRDLNPARLPVPPRPPEGTA